MNRQSSVALLATLMTASAWGQEVSLYGTTMAQMWKEATPGFDKATYAPATQYLGIDATKLGSERLSLHLFGWGRTDLKESTSVDGTKSGGYLNYGYLQYRFERANAEIKAGRFTVNQSTGYEQVDGVSGRTDLVNGFTVSAFAGKPVLYKTVDPASQKDYNFERDVVFGARLGWRMGGGAEVGLSYVQDGSKAAKDLSVPLPVDYTRKQLGADLTFAPTSTFDLRGRTVFDVANERSHAAEQDYTATLKLGGEVLAAVNYTERNFVYLFAGTNLPSLFRQDQNDAVRGVGGKLTWMTTRSFQMSVDYRQMHRDTFGDSARFGTDLRWELNEKSWLLGMGAHAVNADKALFVDPVTPFKSLSHREFRAWTMVMKGRFTASLDGIMQHYEAGNPYLAGMRTVYEAVGSLGFQATPSIKVSGDLSFGSNPVAKHETRGLLRAEYRFGAAKKGGK